MAERDARKLTQAEELEDADRSELDVRFTYHPPTGDQRNQYRILRSTGRLLGAEILARVPESREREKAMEHLEAAIMWANAGIARRTRFDG